MIMKVVLIKSPKFLAPILRAVFKIEKVKSETWHILEAHSKGCAFFI